MRDFEGTGPEDLKEALGGLLGPDEGRDDPQVAALRAAGYAAKDEDDLLLAWVAWTMAETIRRRALAGARSDPPRSKIGRNAPCPCGSGRKFKKCCLDGTEVGVIDALHRGVPHQMIPRPLSDEQDWTDEDALLDLLCEDPAFRNVRLNRRQVRRFALDRAPKDLDDALEEERAQALMCIAEEYIEKHRERTVYERLTTAALRWAESRRDLDELRVAATALRYAAMEGVEEGPEGAGTPLPLLIFQATLADIIRSEEELVGSMKPARDAFEAVLGGCEVALSPGELLELLEDPPEALAEAFRPFEDRLRSVLVALEEGRFPVLLPFPCMPAILIAKATRGPDDPSVEKLVRRIMKRGPKTFGQEDEQLYRTTLEDWLDDGGEDEELVRSMLALLDLGAWAILVPFLLLATLLRLERVHIPWAVEAGWPHGLEMDSDDLSHYAELLREKGFPEIAARVRKARRYL